MLTTHFLSEAVTERRKAGGIMEHIDGTDHGDIRLYALSTCVWCKKTRALLDELGVGYDYVYVDKLPSAESEQAKVEIKQWNPRCSFPTIVIDNKRCIVGFSEGEIRELLG